MATTPTPTVPGARPGDPCVMVIFGASGDLTKRKLIPALYNLAKDHLLAQEFALIGYARAGMTTDEFRAKIRDEIQKFATTKVDPDLWHWFERRIYYVSGAFDDPKGYEDLKAALVDVDQKHGTRGNVFFYLATAPNYFGPIVKQLEAADLVKEDAG